MNNIDPIEQGSQHSGSFGSDNTEALLSVSLRDFGDNDSLLESVLQVDTDIGTAYKSPKDVTSYVDEEQEHLKAAFVHEGVSPPQSMHRVTFAHQGMSKDLSVHNGTSEAFLDKGIDVSNGIQGDTSYQYSQRFEQGTNFDQGFNFNMKKSGNLFNVSRKFSSESEATLSGRESVIKHHSSSVPTGNPELVATTKQSQVNTHTDANHKVKPVNESRHLSWGPSELIGDNMQYMRDMNGQGGLKGNSYLHNGQDMSGLRQGNIGDVYGHVGTIRDHTDNSKGEYNGYSGKQKFGGGRVMAAFISETEGSLDNGEGYYENAANQSRGHEEIPRSNRRFHDDSMEQRKADEMLLGVKHDPETNGNWPLNIFQCYYCTHRSD